jgi:AbrB family looped-hinge helix DNA binding protein
MPILVVIRSSVDRGSSTVFKHFRRRRDRWLFRTWQRSEVNSRNFVLHIVSSKINRMATYQTVISSKGQVVIPAELRERLGLQKGARAMWGEEKGRLVLTPIERVLDDIQGFLEPAPGKPSMFEEILKERERERERERKRR